MTAGLVEAVEWLKRQMAVPNLEAGHARVLLDELHRLRAIEQAARYDLEDRFEEEDLAEFYAGTASPLEYTAAELELGAALAGGQETPQ